MEDVFLGGEKDEKEAKEEVMKLRSELQKSLNRRAKVSPVQSLHRIHELDTNVLNSLYHFLARKTRTEVDSRYTDAEGNRARREEEEALQRVGASHTSVEYSAL